MKKLLAIAVTLVVSLTAFCEEIPASITSRRVTEQTWRELDENLHREVAAWRTPTHTPELLGSFWEPLFALKPQYYSVGDEYLGEVAICQGTWFEAYRGKTVAELVAIGAANQKRYKTSPLSVEEAASACLAAHLACDCRKYLAVILIEDQEIARTPGLTPAQTSSFSMSDLAIIDNDRQPVIMIHESAAKAEQYAKEQAKHREIRWAFMEIYNKALYEKLHPASPTAREPACPTS